MNPGFLCFDGHNCLDSSRMDDTGSGGVLCLTVRGVRRWLFVREFPSREQMLALTRPGAGKRSRKGPERRLARLRGSLPLPHAAIGQGGCRRSAD